jgi:hypothetical protein
MHSCSKRKRLALMQVKHVQAQRKQPSWHCVPGGRAVAALYCWQICDYP